MHCDGVPVAGSPMAGPRVVPALVHRGLEGGEPEELVWKAASDLVISIEHLEHEYEAPKLEKKIREYFKKSAKNLDFFRKHWTDLINDYADAVYEMLFQGLFGRPWLMQGEADFLLVLDAGIKEHFPPAVLDGVKRNEFEQTVLVAHDKAFEEQRYMPILDDVSRKSVEGQKMRKKLVAAGEAGRKEAADYGIDPSGSDEIEEFVVRWINFTIARLAKETGNEIDWILTEDAAVQFFTALMEADAVPVALTKAHAPPRDGWVFIHGAVNRASSLGSGSLAPRSVELAPLPSRSPSEQRERQPWSSTRPRCCSSGCSPCSSSPSRVWTCWTVRSRRRSSSSSPSP